MNYQSELWVSFASLISSDSSVGLVLIASCSVCAYLSRPMMKALSFMQWLVSCGHCLILVTRL